MNDIDQGATPLFDAVKNYVNSGVVQFHVPGHKQGRGIKEFSEYIGERVLQMDANGMEDLDYINHPTGVIKESQELCAKAFNAGGAYFLVNGTTSGVQAMILAACDPGSEIILPRNAHRSAIGGMILSGAIPVFIKPVVERRLGFAMGVSTESVKETLRAHPCAKALFIINPTYYGPCSDIRSVTEAAHRYGIPVLADEAHGTHLYFHPELPTPAIRAGADMSALSVHKTGGSMTQSSLLLRRGDLIGSERIQQALGLTYTSSASYPLMCSLDIARKQLAQNGRAMLTEALKLARYARKEINEIEGLTAFGRELMSSPGCFDFDETKLGVHVRQLGRSGCSIESLLRKKYNIQIELSDPYNILSVVTIADRQQDLDKLLAALAEIAADSDLRDGGRLAELPETPDLIVSPREAFYGPKKTVELESSAGEISGEMIMAYPPGIPVVCMGERITKEVIDYIRILKEEKCELQGAADPRTDTIRVLGTS